MDFENFLKNYKDQLDIIRKHPLGTDFMDLLEESWNYGRDFGFEYGYKSGHRLGYDGGYDAGYESGYHQGFIDGQDCAAR